MGTHTPGPWSIGRHPHNVVAIVEGRSEIVATIGDMPCIGGHDDLAAERGSDMEHANARLIAAAPDLLAALERVMRWTSPIAGDNCEDGAAVEEIASVNQARAAIERATGATHEH